MALSEGAKKSKNESNYKYKKENCVQFAIRINKKYDQDVLQKLESVDNKRQYILNLIRKDIESSDK